MWKDKAMRLIMMGAASTSIVIVILIFLFLGKEAAPFAIKPGLGDLFDSRWVPVSFVDERYGILPLLSGSLLVTGLAMLVTIPFSVLGAVYIAEIASAIFLSEYAGQGRFTNQVRLAIITLAGVPSVVYGLFGFGLFVLFLDFGTSILSGSLTLACMILPTIIVASEEALRGPYPKDTGTPVSPWERQNGTPSGLMSCPTRSPGLLPGQSSVSAGPPVRRPLFSLRLPLFICPGCPGLSLTR